MNKLYILRGGNVITEKDMQALVQDGIDDEALVIIYNSTHDKIQKLLIEELAALRNVSLQPEPMAA